MERPLEQITAQKLQTAKLFLACALETKSLVDSALADNPDDEMWQEREKKILQKIEQGRETLYKILEKILNEEPDRRVQVVDMLGQIK